MTVIGVTQSANDTYECYSVPRCLTLVLNLEVLDRLLNRGSHPT